MVNSIARLESRRWLAGSLLLVLLRALPNLSYPIGRDQASYLVIGEGLLRGQRLYRDLWDVKPPGIFALYAPLVKLFGHVMWSVGLIDILWLLAVSYCLFRFTMRFLGPHAAAVAVVVNASWHCANGYVDAAQPECFVMLLVFAGYFLVAGKGRSQPARDLLAGLCLGGAFWLKYNTLAFLPLLAVFPYLDWRGFDLKPCRFRLLISWRAWLSRVAPLLAGLLITVGVVVAYFCLTGLWASFRAGHLAIVPRYGAASEAMPHFWIVAGARALLGLGWWTVLATGVSVFTAGECDLSRLLPVLASAAMGFAVTASQLRFPPYAFETTYPFLAAIWGYLALKSYEGLKGLAQQKDRQWMAKLLAVALLAIIVVGPLRTEVKTITGRYRDLAWWRRDSLDFFTHYPAVHFVAENLDGELRVIRTLRSLSAPGDGMFIWGTAPLIYYMTGLRPPTRFLVTNHPLISPWGRPEWRDELVRDLEKTPPAFLVVARRDKVPDISLTDLDSEQYLSIYPSLSGFISGSYDRVAEFPGFVVYQRKLLGRN
jgi:hypothetical protein